MYERNDNRPPTLSEYSMAKKELETFDFKHEFDKLEAVYEAVSDKAVKIVIKAARQILQNDPDLDEFVMAMGACFFTIKEGGKYDALNLSDEEYDEWCESPDYVREYQGMIDDENFQKEFFDIVDELDDKYKVKGYPTRFQANSKEVHEWGDTHLNPVVYKPLDK